MPSWAIYGNERRQGLPPPPGGVTWNPADKHADVTLSNGDLTMSSGTTDRCVRSTGTAGATDKIYVEFTITTLTFDARIGMAGDTFDLGTRIGDEFPSKSFALSCSAGNYLQGNSGDNNTNVIAGGVAESDSLDMAYDHGNKKVWFRKNGGNWKGGGGTDGDPAANTNGLDAGGGGILGDVLEYAIACTAANGGDTVSAVFAAASWARSAPSGYVGLS
jgi:hypothetical protein